MSAVPAVTTVNAVIDAYLVSPQFDEKAEGTRKQYRPWLKTVRAAWGPLPAADLRPHHVQQLMDTLGKTKGKANNIRSALKTVSSWALKRNHISVPWTEGIDPYTSKGGHKPWTEDQCRAAEAKFAGWLRRAYFLGLVTGQRGSDVIRIGFADVHDGNLIHVIQEKTKVECWCPIEAPLAAEMRTWEKRTGPFVYQADGTPITKAALDVAFNRIRDKMPELEGTTWHGLRANRVVELRRRGLTTLQIQDLVGMSIKMVERYCRFADKKANAEATIIQMEERRTERNRNQKGGGL